MKFRKWVQQILCFSIVKSEITYLGTKTFLCMGCKLFLRLLSGTGFEYLVEMKWIWGINEMPWPKGTARPETKGKTWDKCKVSILCCSWNPMTNLELKFKEDIEKLQNEFTGRWALWWKMQITVVYLRADLRRFVRASPSPVILKSRLDFFSPDVIFSYR